MRTLSECEGCRRHVDATEPSCPFCGDRWKRGPRRSRRIVGPVTRAMVFYGASALAACAETAPTETVEAEATSEPPMQPAVVVAPETADEEPSATAIGPVEVAPESAADRQRERAHAESRKHRRQRQIRIIRPHDVAPPYGAPPLDAPIV